jgi:hypothetical protein
MRNQGRNDFVDREVQRLEQIAAVVETQIPAKNLRDFFTKKGRPVIYGAFVASVYGERIQGGGPVTKPMHITSTIVQEMLDENGELRPVQGQYAIGDAYNCIKTVYNMCTNPGGLQVANYLLLLTKATFIAQHFAEDKRFPKFGQIDQIFNKGGARFYAILFRGPPKSNGFECCHASSCEPGSKAIWANTILAYITTNDFTGAAHYTRMRKILHSDVQETETKPSRYRKII